MTPRLTKTGRKGGRVPLDGDFIYASRPSPAERLRQRRKARAAFSRSMHNRLKNTVREYLRYA